MKGTVIGYSIIHEDTVMINNGFECAAWYEEILVKKGKYPIIAYNERRWDGYIQYDGEIVSDYFGSLFCGVPIGTYDCKKNAGKKTYYHPHIYGFMLAKCILENDGHNFGGTYKQSYELAEGFKAVWEEYEWDGVIKKAASIVKESDIIKLN